MERSLNEGELGYDYKVRYIDWDVDTEEELERLVDVLQGK